MKHKLDVIKYESEMRSWLVEPAKSDEEEEEEEEEENDGEDSEAPRRTTARARRAPARPRPCTWSSSGPAAPEEHARDRA